MMDKRQIITNQYAVESGLCVEADCECADETPNNEVQQIELEPLQLICFTLMAFVVASVFAAAEMYKANDYMVSGTKATSISCSPVQTKVQIMNGHTIPFDKNDNSTCPHPSSELANTDNRRKRIHHC